MDRQVHRRGQPLLLLLRRRRLRTVLLKFCSYFPYNAKLCINGHHWAQRQAARAGLGFTALDNAFAAVDNPDALQAICDRLTGPRIDALLRKWLTVLPDPFTASDRDAGYRYDLSILQAEFSLTQMLDAPVSGRVFFEQVIRDNLDLGRPDQVTLVFDRRLMRRGPRAIPGRFRTRVITEGVTPSLHVDYKHTTIKQYHKEGRALRTETTINDTRDFHLGKRLTHLPALREIGFHANRRLLCVQRLSHDPIIGADALAAITAPVTTTTGTRVPGLRFADQRSHALFSALLVFRLHPNGFTNKDLRTLIGELRGLDPDTVSAGQMTYDLRRLKPAASSPGSRAPTGTASPTSDSTPRSSSPVSTTGSYASAWLNSPLRQPLPAASDRLPPRIATLSIPSPAQRNSQPEISSRRT